MEITKEELIAKVKHLNEKREYQEVINLLHDDILNSFNSDELFAEAAQANWRIGNKDICNHCAKKAIDLNKENPKALHYLGNILGDKGNYEGAIKSYLKAIEIDPKFQFPYAGLGNAYKELGDLSKSIKYFEIALLIDKNDEFSSECLIDANYMLGNLDKTIEAINKSIAINPNAVFPYAILGHVYLDKNQYEQAIATFKKCLQIDPLYFYATNQIAKAYHVSKEYKESIKYYKDYLELAPKDHLTYYNLGLVFFDMEDYDNSLSNYEKYILLKNDSSEYFSNQAQSKIIEIKKLLANTDLSKISELVLRIKKMLLYEEKCITHYTSLTVGKTLILEKSNFRLSEGAFLNDTSEGRELFKYLDLQHKLKNNSDTIAEAFTQKPFIGSFVSENKFDDLTMWRMYGKEDREDAKGISITFNRKDFLDGIKKKLSSNTTLEPSTPERKMPSIGNFDDEFCFYRVAYMNHNDLESVVIPGSKIDEPNLLKEHLTKLKERVNHFNTKKDNNRLNLFEILNTIAYLFKSTDFQYEHELRLIVNGIGFKKEINKATTPPRIYIELAPIPTITEKITLGPKVERPDEWAAAFHYCYPDFEKHPEILISHLPFK